MVSIKIIDVQKIDIKEDNSIYSYVGSNKELLSWNIKESKTPSYFLEGLIIITCKSIIEVKDRKNLTIEIVDPLIISKIRYEGNQGRIYIIFKVENIPEHLLNSFIKSNRLNFLVEMKSKNLSKNSLKFITFSSLENLIFEVFENSHFSNSDGMSEIFKDYFEQLIKVNEVYFPSSLRDVQEIKEKTVIHNLNSWYIFLFFFKEQMEDNLVEIKIPNLSKEIKYKNWIGAFFDRENPLWEELYPNSRQHYPSKKYKVRIYNTWKNLTQKSPSE
jgi:hypothetical protein